MNTSISPRIKLDWANLLGYNQVRSVQGAHRTAAAQAKIGMKVGVKAGVKRVGR